MPRRFEPPWPALRIAGGYEVKDTTGPHRTNKHAPLVIVPSRAGLRVICPKVFVS
jgi:hypothetical protein